MKEVFDLDLDYKAIGKRIKAARIKKGVTQDVIAERIGITPQHMSNVETANSKVSLATLVMIANELDVSFDELLCDTLNISKAVYDKEVQELLEDCSTYEVRVLVDILKTTKETIRKNLGYLNNEPKE